MNLKSIFPRRDTDKKIEPPLSDFENILDYVEQEQRSFHKKPFCDEDSVVLTQLAYLRLDEYVKGFKVFTLPVSLKKLISPAVLPNISRGIRETKKTARLLKLMAVSPRFKHMKIRYFVNNSDTVEEKQFCAVTFLLDDRLAFVAYRGTDGTLVGWKENFNMAFKTPVPAQQEGLEYLMRSMESLRHRRFIVGGHSKGGNIAVYSALHCPFEYQNRIEDIYNLDGPGFKDSIFDTDEFRNIKGKVHTILPQDSIIGTLLHQEDDRRIVQSTGSGFGQHNPFCWIVKNGKLSDAEGLTKDAVLFDGVLDAWLDGLDTRRRELMVTTLFDVFANSGAANFSDVMHMIKDGEISALKSLHNLPPAIRKEIVSMLRELAVAYVKVRLSK